jgi:hypothetical protein
MNLSKATEELDRLFDIFNQKYFDNKIEKPMIVIQSVGKKPAYGWFTINKLWKQNDKEFYEITIGAEYLNRSKYEICSTLIHEMCHALNNQLEVKDTSNNLVYHNKKFKYMAEKMLEVKHDPKLGWSITLLSDSTKEFVDILKVNEEVFKIFRQKIMKPKVENKYKLYTYECSCGIQIKSKLTTLSITCDECNSSFNQIEVKKGRKKK